EAILEALEMQRRAGMEVFVDGEFRRHAWQTDMADAVEGFVEESLPIAWRGPGTGPEPSSARIVAGKLAQRRRLTAHESAFLKAHAPGPFKITIPSPSVFMTQSFKPGVTDQFYPSREDLTRDLVAIV